MYELKGVAGQKATFDGQMVTITKRGQSRTFFVEDITNILTSRGRVEFGLNGEETAAASGRMGLSWNQASKDVSNTRVITHNPGKKRQAQVDEFLGAVRQAQRAAKA